ncbi:hypothetical protein [Priestia koreensis]|uniref:hypothetical protein n=1 Tax=Priestia koreensis TaxID=284581 RepID=UPI0006A9644D|nr:hypothetical protein [Priestia koreensis]
MAITEIKEDLVTEPAKMEKGDTVYIRSLEAADIYSYIFRNKELSKDYVGSIPYSLENLKLRDVGMKVKKLDELKIITDDMINVKFNIKVQSASYIIEKLVKIMKGILTKIEKEEDDEVKEKLNKSLKNIELRKKELESQIQSEQWQEVKVKELRYKLYKEGFIINKYNKKTKMITPVHYVLYGRTASKSRKGECLFINAKLKEKIEKWSNAGLKFDEHNKHDLASLAAYKSLVSSSLEGTIKIHPSNMLIVDDKESSFEEICSVVRKDEKVIEDKIIHSWLVRKKK